MQEWRLDPRLAGRFHPDHRDEVPVLVHDGGPRFSRFPPELVWVRITGVEGNVFTGRVLNQPVALRSIEEGSTVRFVAPTGGEHLLLVTEKYLRERGDWRIHPCPECGLSEVFDAPSDLVRVQFPDAPADAFVGAFTVMCPLCSGAVVLERKV